MTIIEIRPLLQLTTDDIRRVVSGYVTQECYQVRYTDSPEATALTLELVQLSQPNVHTFSHFDAEALQLYNSVLPAGFSFGAYQSSQLVGFLVAEKRDWNNSLWVWEYHVAADCRGQGIGRKLMEAAEEKAVEHHLRVIICETQNRNAGAIKAYRALGFRVEGIDISHYTNEDYPDRDVAVFMKKRLAG